MTNLLVNPGFEGEYRAWNGINEIQVAQGWYPFWVAHQPGDEEWRNRRPVYKAATRAVDARRVLSGQAAQMYYTSWGTHIAGLMQTVPVVPGQRLRFQAYGHAWSSEEDAPDRSVNPTNMRMKIGIDPTGGTNPFGPDVVWSAEKSVYDSYDSGFTVEATASASRITVFLLSAPEWPKKHNDVYWDDASLVALEEVEPGSDVPLEGNVSLAVESENRRVGEPVTIRVTSPRPLTNVHLVVSGPVGSVPMRDVELSSGAGGYEWRWQFIPEVEGPYTATFGALEIDPLSATVRIAGIVPPPQEEPEPVPSVRGRPRTQYSRVYVLLPPGASREWVQAILDSGAWDRYRWTIGASADDAGIGDLDSRAVLVINPAAWPSPITPWFEQWYPGVRVRTLDVTSPAELRTRLRNFDPSELD